MLWCMKHAGSFLDELKLGGFLLDGAMGSSLLAGRMMPPEKLARAVLTHPKEVSEIHRSFLEAGSRLLLTHSFGANACALRSNGISESVEQLNTAAGELALGAARSFPGTWVAGNLGPVSLWCTPEDRPSDAELGRIYLEQAAALKAAKVDLLQLETFGSRGEALLALAQLLPLGLPVVVSLTLVEERNEFKTLQGAPLLQALQDIEAAGATAVGINCGAGADQALECVRTLVGHLRGPLIVKPNAGLPEESSAGEGYSQAPREFAEYMKRALALGAAAVGGCCGTDGRFIASLRVALARG
jgi:methionine synthase I (cobalamin-dependent)